jgi:hypothetical protein
MKFDFVNMVQIFLMICLIMTMVSYFTYYYKENRKNIEHNIVNISFVPIFQYLKTLVIEDYVVFEKYRIWRFSGRF